MCEVDKDLLNKIKKELGIVDEFQEVKPNENEDLDMDYLRKEAQINGVKVEQIEIKEKPKDKKEIKKDQIKEEKKELVEEIKEDLKYRDEELINKLNSKVGAMTEYIKLMMKEKEQKEKEKEEKIKKIKEREKEKRESKKSNEIKSIDKKIEDLVLPRKLTPQQERLRIIEQAMKK